MTEDRSSMLTPRRRLLFGFFAALLTVGIAVSASPNVQAQSALGAALGAEELKLLREIEAYLNGISTLNSRFVQVTSEGAYAEGEVSLARPDRVRFEYDPPDPVLLISDGARFIYYDKELEQATHLSLEDTPLWFIMREEVVFDDRIRVIDLVRRGGSLYLTLEDARYPDLGQVTLLFSEGPLQLRRWDIRDPQGIVTEVALIRPTFDQPIDREVFSIRQLPGMSPEEILRPQGR